MNNQSSFIQQISGNLKTFSHSNILKDGSSVFVKVISHKENNIYEGSVAGKRVRIFSLKTLKAGSSFVATITSKDGKIFITPKNIENNSEAPFIQINQMGNVKLAQLLCNLGVPVNNLSASLLKMMMQLEMKLDGNVIRNIYLLAVKHKGKEKAAGEILMMLKEKGIDISPDDLDVLLNYLNSVGNDNNQDVDYKKSRSLINKVNKDSKGWTIVPYNLVNIENDDVLGGGVIRILYGKYNLFKMINLNCYFNDREYLFNIKFENKKCNEIMFNINPFEKNENYYVERVKSYFCDNNISIKWCKPELIEGFASEGKEIYSFDGEV